MRQPGRIQAAIDVLTDVLDRHTPVAMALRDWGKANRFAGSKDRSAIGNLVYDALRCKSSLGFRMGGESPRNLILGATVFMNDTAVDELVALVADDKFGPGALSGDEVALLNGKIDLTSAPDWVQADVPDWLWPAFENNFTDDAIAEGQALTARPPLDMRVNTIKATVGDALKALSEQGAQPCPSSPIGLRVAPAVGSGRLPNVQIEKIYQTGGIEIQDEGSQIVSLLVNAQPGEQILDYCAGGGGKSLALAADMNNEGAVHAFDIDKRRLAPLYQRAARNGADIVNVVEPPSKNLENLLGKMDKVLIDAPCSGVGTWRRKPDAKWRLSEDSLEKRYKEQRVVLAGAKAFVKPGGLLFYVTCSMLAEENEGQVYTFLEANPEFTLLSAGEVYEERIGVDAPKPWSEDGCTLTLTPASTGTDGFYFAVMAKE
ncbi:RsmB/NOP family class I SAM-dependent RNA methyltransferase [Fretibacter rubidus]|uniref:RsmB/NOP family class I SAM-dependent RNA methyltransferase n=1 Tax=Fretibacter rubidus TaxID=570162 RepID=UPI00352BAEB1